MVVMVITHPAELDTISHRLDRIGRDSMRVEAIVREDLNATDGYRNRVLTRLIEDKMLLSAHLPEVLDRIATLPLDQQPQQIAGSLRPMTLAIEQANIAIARLRSLSAPHR